MATQQQTKTPRKGDMQAGIPASQLEAQHRYWREHFRDEPYYMQGKAFDAYEPAYRLGIEARNEHPDQQFLDIEDKLRMQYEANPQTQRTLDWADARDAVRAAWERTGQVLPGDSSLKQQSRH